MNRYHDHPAIAVVVGTRAQLVKTAPVMKQLLSRNIKFRFIYTAQHKEKINDLVSLFQVKSPDYVLIKNIEETKTLGLFFSWSVKAFTKLFLNRKEIFARRNGIVLTHGDTVSCVWGAMLGKLTGNKVLHLESGLRSFHLLRPFPEEICRLITFYLSDVYACPNEWALNNINHFRGEKFHTKTNTLYDAVQLALSNEVKPSSIGFDGKFVVVNIHRYEHVFFRKKFMFIINFIETISSKFKVVFIMHPVTRHRIIKYGLLTRLESNGNILLHDRLSFFQFIHLVRKAEFIITDGGSNQEELHYLGIPTLILRETSERIEGLNENALVTGFNQITMDKFVSGYKNYRRPIIKLSYAPSKIIVDWLTTNGYA